MVDQLFQLAGLGPWAFVAIVAIAGVAYQTFENRRLNRAIGAIQAREVKDAQAATRETKDGIADDCEEMVDRLNMLVEKLRGQIAEKDAAILQGEQRARADVERCRTEHASLTREAIEAMGRMASQLELLVTLMRGGGKGRERGVGL